MADKVGIALEATGADQFARSMQTITQRSKELASELKAVTAAFDKTDTSEAKLTAQSQVLQKQIDNQKAKIEQLSAKYQVQVTELDKLRTELEQAVAAHGKDSAEAAKAAQAYDKQTRAVSTTKTQLNNAEAALSTMTRQLESNNTAVKKAEAEQKSLSSTIQDQRSRLGELKTAYAEAVAQYGKHSTEAKGLAKEIKSLSGELKDNESTMDKAEQAADELDKTVEKAGESAKSAANGGFTVLKGILTNLATDVIRRLASGLKEVVSSMLTLGVDFTSTMSTVQALSGATAEEFEVLESAAREAGKTTIFSATEAGEALQYMALAGWDVEQSTSALPSVLNLAAAGAMDLGEASDILTDYLTAFGLTCDDAAKFADQMTYAMANSNTNVEQLGEAYKNCAATAGAFGFTTSEVTAVLAGLANAGIKGGEAGTALNAVMVRLATNTKDCASTLAEYGVEIYDAEGNMHSLSDILEGISGVWADLTDEQQANLGKIIAGQNHYSSFMTIMDAVRESADEGKMSFADYAKALENCDGVAQEMADTMNDNLAGDLKTLQSNVQELGLQFFESLEGPMRKVVQTITNTVLPALQSMDFDSIAQKIADFAQKAVDAVASIDFEAAAEGIVSGIETIVSAAGKIMDTIQWVIDNWGTVKAILTGVATALAAIKIAQFAAAIVSLANPLGIVVTAIAGLAVAVATHLDEIKAWFQAAAIVIKAGWQAVGDFFTGLWDGIKQTYADVKEFFGSAFTAAKDSIETAFATIGDFFTGVWTGIQTVFSTVQDWFGEKFNAAKTAVTNAFSTVVSFYSGIWTGIKNVFSAVGSWFGEKFNAAKSAVTNAFSTVVSFFSGIWNGIKNAFSGAREGFANIGQQMISGISDAVNFFKNLPSQALQWGKDLLGNFIDGIKSKFSALTNAVSSAAGKVRSFLHFSQPDEGPLSDFNTYAPDMMALYAKGIRSNIPMVQSALDQMTGQMADTILTNQAAAAQGATVTTTNMGGVTITINAHEGQSPQDIADVVMERIQHAVSQREAVFA